MKRGIRTAAGKLRKWTFWLMAVAIAAQLYLVQEVLAAFAFFVIGFGVLTLVVLSLYFLQKGWENVVARIFDDERWMVRGAPAALLGLAAQELAGSRSAQDLETEKRNSKDWKSKGTVNWLDGEKWAERI